MSSGGTSSSAPCESYRFLAREGARELASGGLVEIGAHTVAHPVLARLPAADQRAEIRESQRALVELVNAPVTSFAYPDGAPDDFDGTSEAELARAGFQRACTTMPGLVGRDALALQLPRLIVRNLDLSEFAARLNAVVHRAGR